MTCLAAAALLGCAGSSGAAAVTIEVDGPLPVAVTRADPPRAREAHTKAEGAISWETSERAARERARRAGSPLLVWARADWTVHALAMEREVWTDPRVVKAARGFVALRLDLTGAEGDAERLAERYEIRVMPMVVLFDARGSRAASIAGYTDAARLAAALAEVSE